MGVYDEIKKKIDYAKRWLPVRDIKAADFETKSEEGGAIPVIFGTAKVPVNIVWQGDFKIEESVENLLVPVLGDVLTFTVATITVEERSFDYYTGLHAIICLGSVDYVAKIKFDGNFIFENDTEEYTDILWRDFLPDDERTLGLTPYRSRNFRGIIDLDIGLPTQVANPYMVGVLGSDISAYKGMSGLVFRQPMIGDDEKISEIEVVASRIKRRFDGLEQWYINKAIIPTNEPELLVSYDDSWFFQELASIDPRYDVRQKSDTYSDEDEAAMINELDNETADDAPNTDTGPGAFGNLTSGTPLPNRPYPINTEWNFPTTNPPLLTEPRKIYYGKHTFTTDGKSDILVRGYATGIGWLSLDNEQLVVNSWRNEAGEFLFENNGRLDFEVYIEKKYLTAGEHTLRFKVDADPDEFGDTEDQIYFYLTVETVARKNMNPAHIIRECLTDPYWGMNVDEGRIDDKIFENAADTLYDEEFGLSFVWDRASKIEDFINTVLQHIDAIVVENQITGKFELHLLRDNYDLDDLQELNESNVKAIQSFERRSENELENQFTVKYKDIFTDNVANVSVQDSSLISKTGAVIADEQEYEGITTSLVATNVAKREMLAKSAKYAESKLITTDEFEDLKIGDIVKLVYPDYFINTVMRVISGIIGDGVKSEVKLNLIEDIFAYNNDAFALDGGFSGDPVSIIKYISEYTDLEAPYFKLAEFDGQAAVDTLLSSDNGYAKLTFLLLRPAVDILYAELCASLNISTLSNSGRLNFTLTAELYLEIDKIETSLKIYNYDDIESLTPGVIISIDDELMLIESITADVAPYYDIVVKRGVYDSIVGTHSADATIYVWTNVANTSQTYTDSNVVYSKLLPVALNDIIPLTSLPTIETTMASRAYRPYLPGNLQINAGYFPNEIVGALALTWDHRNRGNLNGVGFDETGQTSEAGVTYNLRIYNQNDILVRTETGLTGLGYTYSLVDEIADQGAHGDIYWNDVKALLHMDADFTDETGRSWLNGSAVISEGQSKFGGGSGRFTAGSYKGSDVSADWAFGTGDYTVECWMRLDSLPTGFYYSPLGNWDGTGTNSWCFFVRPGGYLDFRSDPTVYLSGAGVITTDTWYHVAFSRNSGVGRLFLNGTQVDTNADTGDLSSTDAVNIGRNAKSTDAFYGYVDEVRITKGVGRYTSNFSVATEEFENYAPLTDINDRLRFELESERDGYTSKEYYNETVERNSGYRFGYRENYREGY